MSRVLRDQERWLSPITPNVEDDKSTCHEGENQADEVRVCHAHGH